MKRISNILLLMLISPVAFAQEEVEMADVMRSSGKIYVVVVILLIIFAGLIAYLIAIDRKTRNLEKRLGDKNL